jgi:asparagine synthase (glutamine-hydrolysing)
MCGICGKLTTDIRHRIDEEYILRMNDTLKQRGPDGAGIYISKISANTGSDSQAQVGLGHRRLSIIDLSEAARQPMRNENKTIWLTCNGEIYNFQELRKKLETAGHRFTSRSDTEVIIHLYEDRGVDCVRDLEGMFAFALWDENRKRLLLVRDRLGKKPLYYAISSSSLIFASEISAILVNHELSREIVPEAVDLYLTYGYIPAPQTIFSAVKKLLPAHILVWEDGNIRIGPYWSLSYERKIIMQEDEYCQRILELFGEAVKKRLTSDVPLGAFLSGGIDSSAVVAMMSRFSHQAIKTFSIGFSEGSFDELKYARKVARLFNTEHREYVVKADALEVLPELIRHFGEPFADSSAIATYYLSKMTRQEVTVALNGDGGDEAFGGYERYLANNLAVIYQKFPGSLRKGIAGIISGLAESTKKKDFIRNLKRFISIDGLSPEKSYAFWMSIFERGIKE